MNIVYSKTGSKGNCTIIFDGETYLMVDCGVPLNEVNKGCGYILHKVKNCILTHQHADHSRYSKDVIKRGVCVYSAPDTANEASLSGFYSKFILEKKTLQIGSYRVIAFDLPHLNADYTPCKNFGYLIYSTRTKERLLICTDCHYIPQRFPPCEYYLIECNYMPIEDIKSEFHRINSAVESRRFRSHMSVDCCERFLLRQDLSRAKEIRLIHISKSNGDFSQQFKERIESSIKREVVLG